MMEYKYHLLWDIGDGKHNYKDVQKLLDSGWVPVRETPMAAGGDWRILSALILFQREVVDGVVDTTEQTNKQLEIAVGLKKSDLLGAEDILVQYMGYSRDEAKQILHRKKIEELEKAKLELLKQNPAIVDINAMKKELK